MTAPPAETIRHYLDEHEGREEVHVEDLLTTWHLDRWTGQEMDEITCGLEAAGVKAEPPLVELDRGDSVAVSIKKANGAPPGNGTPPWGQVDEVRSESPSAPVPSQPLPENVSFQSGPTAGQQQTYAPPEYAQQAYLPPQHAQQGFAPPEAALPAYAPQYAPQVARRRSSKATASMVLGILGLLILPIVFSVLAIIFAVLARSEIDKAPTMDGRGRATAGLWLGIVGLVVFAGTVILIAASGG
jgi:hypothetical protein